MSARTAFEALQQRGNVMAIRNGCSVEIHTNSRMKTSSANRLCDELVTLLAAHDVAAWSSGAIIYDNVVKVDLHPSEVKS